MTCMFSFDVFSDITQEGNNREGTLKIDERFYK